MPERYILGIDGGGTKTAGVLVDDEGNILARAVAGPSNPNFVGIDDSLSQILSVITALHPQHAESLACVFIGLAGIESVTYRDFLLLRLKETVKAKIIQITGDAEMLLQEPSESDAVIALICGTGSVAVARSPSSGEIIRVGGWGYLFGDEGSGYALGRDCLTAIAHANDGRSSPTVLTGLLMERHKLTRISDMISVIYGSRNPKKAISDLAQLVDSAAQAGDAVALTILDKAVAQLIEMLRPLAQKLHPYHPSLRISGGVVTQSKLYYDILSQNLEAIGFASERLELIDDPARYAANRGVCCLHG